MSGPMGPMMMFLVPARALCLFHVGWRPVRCRDQMRTQMATAVAHTHVIGAALGPSRAVSRGDPAAASAGVTGKATTTKTRGGASATEMPTPPEAATIVLGTVRRGTREARSSKKTPRESKRLSSSRQMVIRVCRAPQISFLCREGPMRGRPKGTTTQLLTGSPLTTLRFKQPLTPRSLKMIADLVKKGGCKKLKLKAAKGKAAVAPA
ncbi:uncharacterized protein LOC127784925 [Oryza glaberrima]|uniref:uncharacterized protein LOC127784925 n=1 Tax=Oryza glaberrima TaxID=4538 RepID=UPI00224C4F64|nr:uncharacterized protein LOC127784925 [Oryza glaberrima]